MTEPPYSNRRRTVSASALMSSPRTAGTMRARGMSDASRLPTDACSLRAGVWGHDACLIT